MYWTILVAIILLCGIFFKLCKILDGIRDTNIMLNDMNNYIHGENFNNETASGIDLKALIAERCLGIENEIIRLKYETKNTE
jgi:hypothetical protein